MWKSLMDTELIIKFINTKLKEEYNMDTDVLLLGDNLDEFDKKVLEYAIKVE